MIMNARVLMTERYDDKDQAHHLISFRAPKEIIREEAGKQCPKNGLKDFCLLTLKNDGKFFDLNHSTDGDGILSSIFFSRFWNQLIPGTLFRNQILEDGDISLEMTFPKSLKFDEQSVSVEPIYSSLGVLCRMHYLFRMNKEKMLTLMHKNYFPHLELRSSKIKLSECFYKVGNEYNLDFEDQRGKGRLKIKNSEFVKNAIDICFSKSFREIFFNNISLDVPYPISNETDFFTIRMVVE